MALIFCDSFDHMYGPTPKHNVGGGVSSTDTTTFPGRTERRLQAGYGGGLADKTLPDTYNTLACGVAWGYESEFVGGLTQFSNEYGSTNQLKVLHVGDGRLYVRAVRVTTQDSSPTTISLALNQWYYIELWGETSSGSTKYKLRVNEEELLSGTFNWTGLDTNATLGWANFSLHGPGGGANSWVDDLYITDGTLLGDVDVVCLRPDGTHTSQLTPYPGTATNYTCVDDINPDTTDYVTATTSDIFDTYEMEDIGGYAGEIYGLQGLIYQAKVEAGSAQSCMVFVSGLSTYTTADFYPSAFDYHYDIKCLSTSPFTGSAWTPSEIDNMKFGPKRVG
jgi:hypothetical protein